MRKWIYTIMAVSLVGLMAGSQAWAQDEEAAEEAPKKATKKEGTRRKSLHDEFSGQGYGMAGCGLGSIIFGDKPGMIQVLAATTNGWAGTQTFGISSGTSNCADNGDSGRDAALFIEVNKQALHTEIARGEGETINNLSSIYGCSNSKMFGHTLQQNFGLIFPAENVKSEQIQQSIRQTIQHNSELAKTCSRVG